MAFNASQQAAYLQHHSELTFECDTRGITVDLHWAFDPIQQRFPMTIDTVWDRLTSLEFAGTVVPCLQDEDLLLYLCVHGSKHAWMRLFWLYDIATLLSQQLRIDWPQLFTQAATSGSLRMLVHSVMLAHQLFGSALPAPVLQYSHDLTLSRLTAAVYRILSGPLEEDLEHQKLPSVCRLLLYTLRLQPSLRYKLAVCASILVPAYCTDWHTVPLPAALFPLYYVIRPLRLLGKYLIWRR
jgi:hypothetical protein